MVIVRVKWTDWNGTQHSTNVTSDMCAILGTPHIDEEDLFCIAVKYIKRRHTECFYIDAVEILAR